MKNYILRKECIRELLLLLLRKQEPFRKPLFYNFFSSKAMLLIVFWENATSSSDLILLGAWALYEGNRKYKKFSRHSLTDMITSLHIEGSVYRDDGRITETQATDSSKCFIQVRVNSRPAACREITGCNTVIHPRQDASLLIGITLRSLQSLSARLEMLPWAYIQSQNRRLLICWNEKRH